MADTLGDELNIRLGHSLDMLSANLHNGPGWRIGLWVQGCVHRCTVNCLNPHLLDPQAGVTFSIHDVSTAIEQLLRNSFRPIEGVTVLGGEPFEQAAELANLLKRVRSQSFSTMVYSGHTLEHLQRKNDDGISKLLAVTDLLMDGPFLPDQYDSTLPWRGSRNQRLIRLTDRYTEEDLNLAWMQQKKSFSINIGRGGISVSGLQTRESAAAAENILGLRPIDRAEHV